MQQGLCSLCCLSVSFSCRSPTQALLRWLFPSEEVHSHPLHQPLSWPLHHLHHWSQCHHYVNGALQPAKGMNCTSTCWLWNTAAGDTRGPEDHTLFPWDTIEVCSQRHFLGTISCWLKASPGSRLSITTHSSLGQLYHLGVTCLSQKLDSHCFCVKKTENNRKGTKLLLGKHQAKYFLFWSQTWLPLKL